MNTAKINTLKKRMQNSLANAKRCFLLLNFSFLILSACVRVDVYDTDHPEHGKITLATDWSKIGQGITAPQSYTVQVVTGTTNTIDNLFLPGTYSSYIYNVADKITVSETTATVAVSNNIVDPMPDWFFASTLNVTIEPDKTHHFIAVMQQQIRQLNIELTVTEGDISNIQSVTASLSSVANTIDLRTDVCSGTGLKVEPVFSKNGNKLVAFVRLIGLTAETQNLSLNISYVGGSQEQIISDVSNQLTGFATDKHLPMTLLGNISISESGAIFNSKISGWESQGQISGDADEQ